MSKQKTSPGRMNRSGVRTTPGQDAFEVFVLVVSVVLFILPFVNLASVSLSSARATLSGEVFFWPIETQWTTWQEVFRNDELIRSFFFTVFLTVVCTAFSLLLIVMGLVIASLLLALYMPLFGLTSVVGGAR